MRPRWSRFRAWLVLPALLAVASACSALPPAETPTTIVTVIGTPAPPTLAGISGPARLVGQPIPLGDLVVTVQRVVRLDAGSGSTYVGAVLVIESSGGSLDASHLPHTALVDQSLHVYEVDGAATSAVLAAASATPEATPGSTAEAATPSDASAQASPAGGTPGVRRSVRAVVGFRVPTDTPGLQLLIDGRPSGGGQVLVSL